MVNIKEMAENYTPNESKNIAELEKVSVDLDIRTETFTKTDGEQFEVNLITIDKQDYRVPGSVIKQLKTLLEDNPKMEFFKVIKTGIGMQTTYQVVPK